MEKGRIERVFTNKNIEKKEYERKLKEYQWKLLRLQHVFHQEKIATVIVMEGVDAAGKGGAIKRITEHLDPRGFRVMAIAAPEPHEKRYHYLQRFWRKIPQYGQITIFDRSWYGRVLVERIEGFAQEEEWKRAYQEINDFEKLLSVDGYLVIKFYLHISMEEQLARFKARAENPFKRWKLTSEDWRNREKWNDYVTAAEEMFAKTDKKNAPWHVIACNDKRFVRIETLKTIVKGMENYLESKNIELPDYGGGE
nr:UDP-galactose-lipid carrier transferase [uncultured Bacillus sp.]